MRVRTALLIVASLITVSPASAQGLSGWTVGPDGQLVPAHVLRPTLSVSFDRTRGD